MGAPETLPTRPMEVPPRIPPREAKSPSELPVPTDKPSPTSPAMREAQTIGHTETETREQAPTRTVPEVPVQSAAMSSAFFSMSSEMPRSPTEMPVPTEVPSPTSPAEFEGATVTAAGTETLGSRPATRSAPTEIPEVQVPDSAVFSSGMMPSSAPGTPTEMPVPTEVSPTTLGEEDDQELTATVPTAIPEPTIPTLPQPQAEVQAAEVSAPMASVAYSISAPLSSPEEMPVPTEMPSPTSPALGGGEPEDIQVPSLGKPPDVRRQSPSPSELPQVRSSAALATSAAVISSSAGQNSPTEMPVPTELPSPTSPAEDEANTITEHHPTQTASQPPRTLPTAIPSVQAVPVSALPPSALPSALPSGMLDSSAAIDSPSVAVPTELPSPTSPMGEEANVPTMVPLPTEQPPTVTVPTKTQEEPTAEFPVFAERLTAATARAQVTERAPTATDVAKSPTEMPQMDVERLSAELVDSAFALPSPTEMPVPTDMPSPTSPADPAAPVGAQDIPMFAVPGVPSVPSGWGSSVGSSQRPRSPSEMPVPTEQPLPTSPADGWQGDGEGPDVPVEEHSVASTEADPADDAVPPVPVPKLPSTFGVVPTLPPPGSAELPERSVDSAMMDSQPNTPEPEMPVPTDVPSPTSPADGFSDDEAAPLAAPPPAPKGPVEEKPPEDFPPPMPESAPMSSDAATSPAEPPVPVAEGRSQPSSRFRSAPMSSAIPGTATPSDGIRVPTDMPSPTSPARPEVMRGPLPAAHVEEDVASAPLVSASAFMSSSAPRSPSEVPVPTDRPSPTSPVVQLPAPNKAVQSDSARPISASVLDSSDMLLSSGRPESPTEMPVPTDVPSPTTPCDDEGETVTVPTVIPTAQTPTRTVGEGTIETPTQTLVAEGATVPSARTPTATRTFLEVRRTEAVPSVPTADTPTRTLQAPSAPTQTRSGARDVRTARTDTVTQSATRSTRSRRTLQGRTGEPAVEVPTDVPSPTSPARDPTREDETELPPSVLPPTATFAGAAEEEPTILPIPAAGEPEVAEPPVEQPDIEEEVPTDVPSPTSPADAEVGTMPTVELPTLVPLQAHAVLEATSPASPLAEDQGLLGPPQVVKRRRLQELPRPTTPTERDSAPPVPGATPTERDAATPTEDRLLVPPQVKVASAPRQSPTATEPGVSAPFFAKEEVHEPLPPTPTYTAESPEYTDDEEPETPALEPDDEALYEWEEQQLKLGQKPSNIMVDLSVLRAMPQLSNAELPTPTCEPDEEEEEFEPLDPKREVFEEPAFAPPPRTAVTRPAEEELPPWQRRQRRRQE